VVAVIGRTVPAQCLGVLRPWAVAHSDGPLDKRRARDSATLLAPPRDWPQCLIAQQFSLGPPLKLRVIARSTCGGVAGGVAVCKLPLSRRGERRASKIRAIGASRRLHITKKSGMMQAFLRLNATQVYAM